VSSVRAVLAGLLLFLVTACDSADYPGCIGAVRYDGSTYREVGFTDQEGSRLKADAEFASCDDVRQGTAKSGQGEWSPVEIWSLDGYSTDQAVAVKVTGKAWSVLVSDEAPEGLWHEMGEAGLLNAGDPD